MTAHIYKYGGDALHIEASRVTMRNDLSGGPSRSLILGTRPDTQSIPFADIEWFWIEES